VIFDTVAKWLNRCQCVGTRTGKFYPSRLISLERLKALYESEHDGGELLVREHPDVEVNIVETKGWADGTAPRPGGSGGSGGNTEYVTLSHCWGDSVSVNHRLSSTNYDAFRKGILIGGMPKTFRDAIYFAAKLKNVGYIWIDSLCIMQGGDGEDWLVQSADMDRVYSETYLNLSATASPNSGGGLFKSHSPGTLSREQITLNIRGLPGAYVGKTPTRVSSGTIDLTHELPNEEDRPYLRPCTIHHAFSWDDSVDKAPVNTRAWVLQERLMSPRVLHFCRDQIAWECLNSEKCDRLVADDGQPHGLLNFQITRRDTDERMRLSSSHIDGMEEQDALLHWAQIVEAYSKTNLTQPKDKLIALSGMAKTMSKKINRQYVAGLWNVHLASQLLWRVEPLFDRSDRTFSHPATAPKDYRAPSFSWAALDAIDHGIVYGDTTERDMLIKIENVEVNLVDRSNAYGLIDPDPTKRACLTICGKLRAARLFSIENGRYAWELTGRGTLDFERHRNVYLDCPSRDNDCIDNPDAKVFVVPAMMARNIASSEGAHLFCLILRLEPGSKAFSRIGITKLMHNFDTRAMGASGEEGCAILEAWPSDVNMPHAGWNSETGEHLIRLI
jgi:hypothetical protein